DRDWSSDVCSSDLEFPLAARAGDRLCERVQLVARHFVHVFVVRTGQRMHFEFAMAVLAAPAGLLDVLAFGFGLLADGLAVSHLRAADVRFYVEFALQDRKSTRLNSSHDQISYAVFC